MYKLLQLSIEVNSGSVGRIAEQIGETVLDKGWQSFITYARNNNPSRSEVIKIGNNLDLYLHGIKTRIFDNHCFGSSNATIELIKRIKEIKPDIIHLHHLHGYFINIEILFQYLKESNIPIVWTFHDCWSFTGHCSNFDFVGCDKWKNECHHCEQKHEYPASLFFDRSRQNYIDKKRIFNSVKDLTIVSVSKWLSSKVNESFLNGFNSKIIYNGIDLDKFYPKKTRHLIDQKYNTFNKCILLGVATNWDEKKGFNDFLHLSKLLDTIFVIILIGLNKNQISKLPSNIIGIQRTESQEELCDIYSASDLFLNLSVEETFGLTTAEALACGVPAIVYNSTASPELVGVETGFVVEKQNMEALLHAIFEAKSFGKSHFSSACRNRAVSLFDKKERFLEYLNLYIDILNRNENK
jgi:glycosyltransferase involved in cell wall biosynthesis